MMFELLRTLAVLIMVATYIILIVTTVAYDNRASRNSQTLGEKCHVGKVEAGDAKQEISYDGDSSISIAVARSHIPSLPCRQSRADKAAPVREYPATSKASASGRCVMDVQKKTSFILELVNTLSIFTGFLCME